MTTTGVEPERPVEPTVLASMRRHRTLVIGVVLASTLLALLWALLRTEEYRATATISVPLPAGAGEQQTDGQYLDSQVLQLSAPEVADEAAEVAEEKGHGQVLDRADFSLTRGSIEVVPPATDSSGSYGTTVLTIAFTASSSSVAQAGVNAFATAYDSVRSADIVHQARARLNGIDRAISEAESADDLPGLRLLRAQAIIDEQTDLAHRPSIALAERPAAPAQRSVWALLGVGLGFGVLAGGAAAFVRASRLDHVGGRDVAAAVYDAPLLGEAPLDGAAGATQHQRLAAQGVRRRLALLDKAAVVAVVAAPGNPHRAALTADLALALTDDDTLVLAVDAADGAMARALAPGGPAVSMGHAPPPGRAFAPSPLHPNLSVLRLAGLTAAAALAAVRHDADLVVVACPSLSRTVGAVDLLVASDAAVVLVRADEPVQDHVETDRWLETTGTPVLGYVFTPSTRRGLLRRFRRRSVTPSEVVGPAPGPSPHPAGTSEVHDPHRTPLWGQ